MRGVAGFVGGFPGELLGAVGGEVLLGEEEGAAGGFAAEVGWAVELVFFVLGLEGLEGVEFETYLKGWSVSVLVLKEEGTYALGVVL